MIRPSIAAAAFSLLLANFPSARAAETAPVAAVTGGQIRGETAGTTAIFRGIPFAASPVGPLRWREPQAPAPWSGVKQTTEFGPWCMQDNPQGPASEDCLTLNIWAPDFAAKRAKPVMVWFHGGGNRGGAGGTPFHAGETLAKHGVVVVTVNYRLGVLGFLAHPELTAESPHKASGNYGLMDQIAALTWVKTNIAQFGGDPAQVTAFGQSAGGEDVDMLMASPLAKGLFVRAIIQSEGSFGRVATLKEQEERCAAAVAPLNPPARDALAFLRAQPADAVLAAARTANACRPVNVDGWVLPEAPVNVFAAGRQLPVPLMIGSTPRELAPRTPSAELTQNIRETYGPLAERAMALYRPDGSDTDPLFGTAATQWMTDLRVLCPAVRKANQHSAVAPTFQYFFNRELPGRTVADGTHSNEVAFVFGNLGFLGLGESAPDLKLSETVRTYWTNFAKTGDPNGAGLAQWPRYDATARRYVELTGDGVRVKENLRRPYCDLYIEAQNGR